MLCLWRAELDDSSSEMTFGMDIFSRVGELWQRDNEEHTEYVYSFDALKALLEKEAFTDITLRTDGPQGDVGRQFIVAKRGL